MPPLSFAARKTKLWQNDKGAMSTTNNTSTSNQMLTNKYSIADGMMDPCLQEFTQPPTTLMYKLLTLIYRARNTLHAQQDPPPYSQSLYSLMSAYYWYPHLICNCQSHIEAMRTHFYRWVPDTEDHGCGLQWDPISRC